MTTFARFLRKLKKKYNLIMNKELTTAATLSLGVRSYESPAVTVVEVLSEGVLCASGDHEDWGYDDDLWS